MDKKEAIACSDLIEIIKLINEPYEHDVVLRKILENITKVIDAQGGSILLLQDGNRSLFFQTATGEKSKEVTKFRVSLGKGIAGWVAKHGMPLNVSDVRNDVRFDPRISKAVGVETKSIICVPLRWDGKIIGVMEAINNLRTDAFDEKDLEIISIYAEHAANALGKAFLMGKLVLEKDGFRQHLSPKFTFDDILTSDDGMKSIIDMARRAAETDSTILITGESGTGKDILAQSIHNFSPRKEKTFIALNCAAIPEALMEDTFFGHEKGAFTGATNLQMGKFELANGGTIFLDEIGELPSHMQVKLLRVLQERSVERLGGDKTIPVDVRVIASTCKNLDEEIKLGKFREDLYYRLNVVPFHLPPLRMRNGDLKVLTRHFIDKFNSRLNRKVKQLTAHAMKKIESYYWPGNIRELANTLERAIVLSDDDVLYGDILPLPESIGKNRSNGMDLSLKHAQHRFKAEHISKVLRATGGNQTKASKLLKIQRTYLSRLISELNIKEGIQV